MQIIQFLNSLDQQIFLFLNGLNCPLMDTVMWYISGKVIWIPIYLVIVWYLFRERKWNTVFTLIFVAVMITISDQVCNLIKDSVMRFRPSHEPALSGLVHLVNDNHGNLYRGGNFGFISSHAGNSFALATFVTLFFKVRWVSIVMFIWAAIVSYSRIYLGVHYPGDIIGGALVGIAAGLLIYYIEQWVHAKYLAQFNKTLARKS
ncbi:MAG TPA: phosphatase PAP2 family protein [Bacteroidales bacterium]|nr:phosphatase PAP2 family protein [Bacteroidales bacterium]